MRIEEFYQWEVEGLKGIIRQYNPDDSENPSALIDVEDVARVSIIPFKGVHLPRHDILIDRDQGERFIRRFGRGIIKSSKEGFAIAEYLHCVETNNYRLWVFSSTGQCLITNPKFEVYF